MAISGLNDAKCEVLPAKQFVPSTTPTVLAKTTIIHECTDHNVITSEVESHHNKEEVEEWPYAAGFETDYEQHTPVELETTGVIPAYASGTLYRTGPGNYKLETDDGGLFRAHHWFDGFTTVHRFSISQAANESTASVSYNSRRTVDKLLEQVRRTGQFKDFSFAQKRDPCQSFFRKVMSSFTSKLSEASIDYEAQNIGVTLSVSMPGIGPTISLSGSHGSPLTSLITKTDANMYQKLDPETLEPSGVCRQTILHRDLKGPLSGAHAKTCPLTGDIFNYNLDIGAKSIYRVFQVSALTGKTDILATIETTAAYLHSIILTPSTVVLCVWNSHYAMRGVQMLYHRNILDSISPLDPSKPALWYVIDRTPARRGLLATYETPGFFCFHTINAFEEPSQTTPGQKDIVADLCTYPDLSILHRFYYDNILLNSPNKQNSAPSSPAPVPTFSRYRLPNVPIDQPLISKVKPSARRPGLTELQSTTGLAPELPTINPRHSTIRHRFVYGVTDTGDSGFFDGIVKFDIQEMTGKRWSRHGQTAGEPIFVANPDGVDEDDGVILSVVLDGFKAHSYLLCLNARNMQEMGRAEVPGVVGFGFHGIHIPSSKAHIYAGGD